MKVAIIDSDIVMREELVKMVNRLYPNISIVATLTTVAESVKWLNENKVDFVFTDVKLDDGTCFDLLPQITQWIPVIFTSKTPEYAVEAFNYNGIGYLLKPIAEQNLMQTVDRVSRMNFVYQTVQRLINSSETNAAQYKSRMTVKNGDKYNYIEMKDVAYFYSEDKVCFIVTRENKRHMVDYFLDKLEPLLDPRRFFRISRKCIASIDSIQGVAKYFNSRLKVTLIPHFEGELLVSRIRVAEFLKWMDN